MPEHFPTFNRAARLIRSASPGTRTLGQRIGRALATERGILRAGLYGILALGLLFHFVAALEVMIHQAFGPGYFFPGFRQPPGPDEGLGAKAVALIAVVLREVFGAPQFATLAIFGCLVALVATSERPTATEGEPRKACGEP